MDLVTKAMTYAISKHNNMEFINNHTAKVVKITECVLSLNDKITKEWKEKIIAAVWLHDTLEDTETTFADLLVEFDTDIADLVWEVTCTKNNCFPCLETKYGYLIKYCDRTANLLNRAGSDNVMANTDPYYMKSIFWSVEPFTLEEIKRVKPA